jgi:hypothetical protein
MPLSPGTVVEATNGRRGEVVEDDTTTTTSALGMSTHRRCWVRWPEVEGSLEYTKLEAENSLQVVPKDELGGGDPFGFGKGW